MSDQPPPERIRQRLRHKAVIHPQLSRFLAYIFTALRAAILAIVVWTGVASSNAYLILRLGFARSRPTRGR